MMIVDSRGQVRPPMLGNGSFPPPTPTGGWGKALIPYIHISHMQSCYAAQVQVAWQTVTDCFINSLYKFINSYKFLQPPNSRLYPGNQFTSPCKVWRHRLQDKIILTMQFTHSILKQQLWISSSLIQSVSFHLSLWISLH